MVIRRGIAIAICLVMEQPEEHVLYVYVYFGIHAYYLYLECVALCFSQSVSRAMEFTVCQRDTHGVNALLHMHLLFTHTFEVDARLHCERIVHRSNLQCA